MNKEEKSALLSIPVILIISSGLAIAGSQGGATFLGIPVYILCIGLAFLMNWVAFVPAFLYQTERFFDLMGGISFIIVVVFAVTTSPVVDGRSLLLLFMIVIWALRLSTFLFLRVRKAGEDRRFRELKPSFLRFLQTWTLQGVWVSFSLAAALVAITSEIRVPLNGFAMAGFLIWLFGFVFEVVADLQKSRFKNNPANKGRFIHAGLWSWSRHPNYFGEIVLWIGVAIVSIPVLRGWQWVALISPIFITLLLTKISGIPMLEKRADQKWAGIEEYDIYINKTSILIPWPPKKS